MSLAPQLTLVRQVDAGGVSDLVMGGEGREGGREEGVVYCTVTAPANLVQFAFKGGSFPDKFTWGYEAHLSFLPSALLMPNT